MTQDLSKIKNYISNNQIERSINALLELTLSDSDVQIQLRTLLSKFKDLRRKEIMGAIKQEDIFVQDAQISSALLQVINGVENDDSHKREADSNYLPKEKDSSASRVFISYNHNDSSVANKLKERLRTENIEVTIDSEKMVAGSDIKEFIENCIKDTQTTISLISKKSLLSAWVAMESTNTFYHEKTNRQKKFIACYIDDDFFRRDFTDMALDSIEEEITEIQQLIAGRMQKNRSIRDLQNELERMTNLRNNMDEIVRRLRESLCIDIRNDNFENNFTKIVQAIKT